jgi:hypothetical protein
MIYVLCCGREAEGTGSPRGFRALQGACEKYHKLGFWTTEKSLEKPGRGELQNCEPGTNCQFELRAESEIRTCCELIEN